MRIVQAMEILYNIRLSKALNIWQALCRL